jgi:hypothetical protein
MAPASGKALTGTVMPLDRRACVCENGLLEFQTPKLHRSPTQLQTEFPSLPALVSSPNQERFAFILVRKINQPEALSDCKTLGNNSQAPLRAGVYRIPFDSHHAPRLRPFHCHRHSGIYAHSSPDILCSRFGTGYVPNTHGSLLSSLECKRPAVRILLPVALCEVRPTRR